MGTGIRRTFFYFVFSLLAHLGLVIGLFQEKFFPSPETEIQFRKQGSSLRPVLVESNQSFQKIGGIELDLFSEGVAPEMDSRILEKSVNSVLSTSSFQQESRLSSGNVKYETSDSELHPSRLAESELQGSSDGTGIQPLERRPIRYPEPARAQSLEGQVRTRIWIGDGGRVSRIEILESSDQSFKEEVLAALPHYRFPSQAAGKVLSYIIYFKTPRPKSEFASIL